MQTATVFKTYIEKVKPYVGGSTRAESHAGSKIYKLSSNENLLGPSPMAMKAIKKNIAGLFEYNHQDDALFREAIVTSMHNRISAGSILTANSGMELLDIICRGLLAPGDNGILSTPAFLAYKSFAELAGASVFDVPLQPGNYSLDIAGILRCVDERTRLLFIASPNNPTGTVVTREEMDLLLASLPAQVTVVYDEVYHHYVDHVSYGRAADYIEKGFPVIGIHSFSKAYGLAGIRLGYAFGPATLMEYLRKLRRPFMINTLSMEAGIAALGDHEHIQRSFNLVEEEKKWLYQQLNLHGLSFTPSHANYILFRAPYDAQFFAEDMLDGGVMVRTAEVFGAPGFIRVTIGTRQANTAFVNNLKLLL